MFYNENLPVEVEREQLTEWRGKITKKQKDQLKDIEARVGVPMAAMIRMALDSFLPKIKNSGFTEAGIKTGYLNKGY